MNVLLIDKNNKIVGKTTVMKELTFGFLSDIFDRNTLDLDGSIGTFKNEAYLIWTVFIQTEDFFELLIEWRDKKSLTYDLLKIIKQFRQHLNLFMRRVYPKEWFLNKIIKAGYQDLIPKLYLNN